MHRRYTVPSISGWHSCRLSPPSCVQLLRRLLYLAGIFYAVRYSRLCLSGACLLSFIVCAHAHDCRVGFWCLRRRLMAFSTASDRTHTVTRVGTSSRSLASPVGAKLAPFTVPPFPARPTLLGSHGSDKAHRQGSSASRPVRCAV